MHSHRLYFPRGCQTGGLGAGPGHGAISKPQRTVAVAESLGFRWEEICAGPFKGRHLRTPSPAGDHWQREGQDTMTEQFLHPFKCLFGAPVKSLDS